MLKNKFLEKKIMNIQAIKTHDIDILTELQPAGWKDIRPYFNYYTGSKFCDPIKITEGGKIVAIGTTIKHQNTAWLANIVVHPNFRNKGLGKALTTALVESLDKTHFQTIY